MKPLFVLCIVFVATLLSTRLFNSDWNFSFAGNLAMSVMLLFTAFGHFAFPKGMTMMIPQFVPFKRAMVFFTGVIEIAVAIGLMIPSIRYTTSVFLIIFFILLLPANINAAIHKINYQKGTYNGSGLSYLWFRVPLQLFFIGWVWYFGIYNG